MFLHMETYKGAPCVVNFPIKMSFTIAELEESSNSAFLDNGMKVRVPKHVKVGDKAVIDTRTGEYTGKE